MRERVERLVGGVSRVMWVMTFHSACARILRADAQRLGYKRAFTIYDEADSLRMVKRCVEELGRRPEALSAARRARPDLGREEPALDATPRRATREAAAARYFERTVADVYRLYERRMLEANAMDFDDLLVRTVNLLELFEDVRERYRRAFRWVLVDEYQDTNRAQYRLLQLLSRRSTATCSWSATTTSRSTRFRQRRHPQHPRVRARLRRHHGRAAGAELPLHADDPRRRQRDHRQQPGQQPEAPVDRTSAAASR